MANPQMTEASLDAIWNPKLAILQTLTQGGRRAPISPIAMEPLSSPSEPLRGMVGDSLFVDNRNSTFSPSHLAASNQASEALMQRGQQEALIRQLAHSEGGMESNPAWRALMALNPKAGGAMFQADTGMSYDEARQAKMQAALKARNDLATFPRETIQSMIAAGKLRQTGEGQWLQEIETENELGQKIKDWKPANETIMNLLQRAGGASGVGMTELGDAMSKARNGLLAKGANEATVDAHLKAKMASLMPQPQASPEGEGGQQPGNPNVRKGLIPSIGDSIHNMANPKAESLLDNSMSSAIMAARLKETPGRLLHNLKTQLMGGELRDAPEVSLAPSNEIESLNALRLQQGLGPVTMAQFNNARSQGQTNRELLRSKDIAPQLDGDTLIQAIQKFVQAQLSLQ